MDHSGVLALFDRDMREGAQSDGPDTTIERVGRVVRQVAPAHGWNGVLWSDLDESGADAEIARQIADFTALGRAFEWKVYGHDLPVDLARRLGAAGFTPEPEETLMIGEVADLDLDAEPPEGIRIVPVTDAAGVDLAARVHELAFGTDSTRLRQRMLAQLAADPRSVVAVLALAGDEPVSAARLELPPGARFAGLWGGGTVESWRGRGIYRALVAQRGRVAVANGYRYLQVDAVARSRPVLERLGFQPLTTTTPYVYVPKRRSAAG
ncbi:GNAT family N-acetyltransferase [Streptomyces sp. NPDC091377]|uniref:GNAT family N-acetyltransferase n=1 Tax=unclassified Streptomyces TaxID=2593676 RepID=UPI0038027D9F